MPAKSATLDQVMELIREGQSSARERHEDLKTDFEAKHIENRDRRHALGNEISAVEGRQTLVEGRVAIVETKLTSIVGDNSGATGLMHEIRDDVKDLRAEVQTIKTTVQDTPKINKWVIGAMAVLGFLTVSIPICMTALMIIFGLLEFFLRNHR